MAVGRERTRDPWRHPDGFVPGDGPKIRVRVKRGHRPCGRLVGMATRARVPVTARTRSHHRTKGRSTGRFHGAEIPFHANVGLGFRSIRFGSGHWNDPTAQSDFLPCMCACNVRSSTLGPTTPTLFGSCTRTTAKKLEGFRSGCLLCPRLASQCHPGARTATPRHTVDRSFPPNVAISGFRFHCPYCPIVPTYLPSYLLLFTIVVFAHGSQPRPLLETTTTTW
jgi:hypothetical protein